MKPFLSVLFLWVSMWMSMNPPAEAETRKKVVYRKSQDISFDAADIDGVARAPDAAYINQRKSVRFQPLYKLKDKLDREIRESVEYLDNYEKR